MSRFRLHLCAAIGVALASASGMLVALPANADPAHAASADRITIHDAWARASAGGAMVGAAYFVITGGGTPDQVAGIETDVATTAEVHESFNDNGIMKMRPTPRLTIPAGGSVTLAPGGYHVMLMGLKQPLLAGQSFPLTVGFAHAPPITVEVKVRGR
jgi:copper(I)-binding protein